MASTRRFSSAAWHCANLASRVLQGDVERFWFRLCYSCDLGSDQRKNQMPDLLSLTRRGMGARIKWLLEPTF